MSKRIKVGISACLLGQKVRYDGGHKHDRYLTDTLGLYFEFIPVCPESECGLGIPREPMRLVGPGESPRLVTIHSKIDHTQRMQAWAQQKLDQLETENLCGFIFKKDSPSSGMTRVKVYNEKGMAEKKGVGVFAKVFMERFPRIPTEDEGRLHDPVLRENFIERIFVLNQWRALLAEPRKLGKLVAFHTDHKLQILAHNPEIYRTMGKLIAIGKEKEGKSLWDEYEDLLMTALGQKATLAKHRNVLQHIMGYFKKMLTADEKKELIEVITQYAEGTLPLIVPITLMKHYTGKYKVSYLAGQTYLAPHPLDLKLRNHA